MKSSTSTGYLLNSTSSYVTNRWFFSKPWFQMSKGLFTSWTMKLSLAFSKYVIGC